jgi:hypothetical protein
MKISAFFKTSIVACVVFAGVAVFPSLALAWNWGVHVYVASRLAPKDKLDASYGSTVPDIFLYAFDNPCLVSGFEDQTHHNPLPLWTNSLEQPAIPLKAAAFGFVSHNDTWGADSTAHHNGITFGQGEGYITAKAEALLAILDTVPDYAALNVPPDVGLTIAHELTEVSVDILMKRLDPKIGRKIFNAAMGRSKKFPGLLADTYSADLAACEGVSVDEARATIILGEAQWRASMIGYGNILNQRESVAIELLAQQEAAFAGGFLAGNGIVLPPETDLTPLAEFAISTGMDLCKDDFAAEVSATVSFVGGNLAANGVSY